MFQTNDTIRYGTEGVCVIADVKEMEFAGVTGVYYVLRPVHRQSATVFVPLENQKLLSKMQPLLTRQEILQAVQADPETLDWKKADQERRAHYHEVLGGGNRRQLIRLVKALYQRRATAKLYAADERFLKEAERILTDEFSYVLDLEPEQVPAFLHGEA